MSKVMAGDLIAPILAKAGVSAVFGLNGGHIQAILEGCLDHGIRLIDVRHESAAGHAAEGYAKATRGLGVAVITAGPGFTNVLTSLANAFIDRTPVLYIAGGCPQAAADKNVLQSGVDQVAVAKPIAKWAHRVPAPTEIPRLIAHAIRVATSAPTGPVFLEIPWDILLAQVEGTEVPIPEEVMLDLACPPAPHKIDAALALLRETAAPAIIAGVDVYRSEAWNELRTFAEASGLPVFTEYEALGTLPSDHPLWMGTNFQLARLKPKQKPDVVLALGVRFGWNTPGFETFSGRIIHVDSDPNEIGRVNTPAIGIVANAKMTLRLLNERLPRTGWPDRSAWTGRLRDAVRAVRAEAMAAKEQSHEMRPHPFAAAEVVCEAAANAVIVADGAFTKHWLEDAIRRQRPGGYFSHGSFGAMGIGFGFAMGIKVARPDEPVLCVSGDGAAGFTIAELDTLVRQKMPIVVVVMNNHSWGAVDAAQYPEGSNRPAGIRLGQARYDEVAKAFGGRGCHVTTLEALKAAIADAFNAGLPTCINVEVGMGGLPPAFKAATLGIALPSPA
ncbi:MAG TPA: thiamine pyrophosphate-binding protein [Steroidobacteraceae bacterium]|jgi:acetolactate synthase-1/2/3 large subunit|nr:thiamine pyrophosphate-binding protein [Steroidobacteraceae bacterium]